MKSVDLVVIGRPAVEPIGDAWLRVFVRARSVERGMLPRLVEIMIGIKIEIGS
jgi:hypothetical protein